jgi:uncharacterized protein (TIRG00374 family)
MDGGWLYDVEYPPAAACWRAAVPSLRACHMRVSRILVVVFFCAGLALLAVMVRQLEWQGLVESLHAIGPWLVPFLLLEGIVQGLHAAGWAACFQGPKLPLRFWQLYLIRLAGTGINQVTPSAHMAGEVVRALLLESVVPRAQAVAPVLIGKASISIAQMGYLSLATLYLMWRIPLLAELQWVLGATIALVSVGLCGFVALQRYGMLSKLLHGLQYLRIHAPRVQRLAQRLAAVDALLIAYYTTSRQRFLRSLLLHGSAFVSDGVKTYVLLWLLLGSRAPSLAEALIMAGAVAVLDQLFFFVPGRIGTLEGVRFTILSTLGVAHVYGFAFGVIARIENLLWSGLGLGAYALCTRCAWVLPAVPSAPAPVTTQQ